MPKPACWMASRTPSQSQRARPIKAPWSGVEVQGSQEPMVEVLQRIWAQRGAPRPMANMGTIQGWRLESLLNKERRAVQTPMKSAMMRSAIVHVGACWLDQRYLQLRLYGKVRK